MRIARFLRSWVVGNPTIDSSHADPTMGECLPPVGGTVHRVCKIMALEIEKSGRKWGQPLNDLTLTATMAWLSKDSMILCSRWGHSVPVFVAKSYVKPPNSFACWSLVFVTQTHISATSTVHNYQFLILKATFVLVLLSIIWHFGKKTPIISGKITIWVCLKMRIQYPKSTGSSY